MFEMRKKRVELTSNNEVELMVVRKNEGIKGF